MADINVGTGVNFEIGTTGDDNVTITDAISTDIIDGNGGTDTLTLNGDAISALTALVYDDVNEEWDLASTGQISGGVVSITTSEGITLTGGTAASGIVNASTATGGAGIDALTGVNAYDWTGTGLTVASLDSAGGGSNTTLVSVDGLDASADGTVSNADGQFTISGTNVSFTPDTAAVTAQGNVGDTATFSYTVVVADADGNQSSYTLTFTQAIGYTPGNDTFVGEDGNDYDGVDKSAQAGLAGDDSMTGANGDDSLTGNDGNDTVIGNAGEDTLNGNAGDDLLSGGADNDTLDGGADNDVLRGGGGEDNITAGAGDDTVFGGNDNDTILGSSGNNTLNGGNGNDTITAGSGDDVVKGGDGNDSITGGSAGTDELRGGAGDDIVTAGAGGSTIYTSLGNDVLNGAAGDDTFILKTNAGNNTIANFAGADKLDVSELGLNDLAEVMAVSYQTDAGVVIVADADTSFLISGEILSNLDNSDFDFA